MARIRTVKPSFWSDAAVAGLSRDCRLLTVGLISFADDQGRFIAKPSAISGYVYPHDDVSTALVKRWRDEVARTGMIVLYQVDGREYGWFPNWTKHQRISKPQPSTLPEPPRAESRNDSAPGRGTVPRTVPVGREGKGREGSSSGSEDPPVTGADAREHEPGGDPPPDPDADPLTRLVAEVQAIRPTWSDQAIRTAARRCTDHGRSPADTRHALLDVAGRTDTTAPGRATTDGPWWPGPPTPSPKPFAEQPELRLPPADPERTRRGLALVRQALADPTPAAEEAS